MMNTIQTTGLDRDPIDKYYTKTVVAEKCINLVKDILSISKQKDTIVEPSAGSGVFYNLLLTLSNNVLMYDIKPEHENVICRDYLCISNQEIKNNLNSGKIHVIGNPPFGRQSSLAIKFIKKSCSFSDTISFILPKSFKKDSMKKAFTPNFHLLQEIELDKNSFTVNGDDHDSPCIFQIWEKRNSPRYIPVPDEPIGYHFVKKDKSPMLSVRRVGGTAGHVDTCIDTKSEQSHYFIVIDEVLLIEKIPDIILLLNGITHEFNNTVGPKSLSKPEIIIKFNTIFKNLLNLTDTENKLIN